MRIWFKFVKNGKIIKDTTITDVSELNRTRKIFHALDDICMRFDLEHPQWLDVNISEFKRRSRTRFTHDSFIESVPFDYLEMEVLEEDY